MMRPQFARDQVSDLDLEERHVQNMMRSLDTTMQSNNWTGLVDLQVLFFRLTLDSATEFLFGQSVDSQIRLLPDYKATEVDKQADEFATAFDRGQMGLAHRARFAKLVFSVSVLQTVSYSRDVRFVPSLPELFKMFKLFELMMSSYLLSLSLFLMPCLRDIILTSMPNSMYWLSNSAEFRESCQKCHSFIDQFVRLALSRELREKELEKGVTGAKEKYIFLEALAAQTQDPIELRSQLLHILLAGRDTTASLLGWLFFCLARDPARFKKLRDTIIQEFGTYEHPSEITFSKLKSCQYLQHCNNEALRLYPVVPINGRYANKDTTLPRGGGKDGKSPIFIPKGTSCDYSVHVMHRRKDIWGPDADDFRPERFENRKVGWEFLPVSIVTVYSEDRASVG